MLFHKNKIFVFFHNILSSPSTPGHHKTKRRAAESAQNVGELRYVVSYEYGIKYLASYIEDKHQNKGYRYRSAFISRKGRHYYHHKYHPAGAEERGAREKDKLGKARNKGCYQNRLKHSAAAVSLLKGRTDNQEKQHIVYVMFIACMAQNMGKKPQICKRIGK